MNSFVWGAAVRMLSRPPHLEASTLVTEYSNPMSFAYLRLRHNLESTNLVNA